MHIVKLMDKSGLFEMLRRIISKKIYLEGIFYVPEFRAKLTTTNGLTSGKIFIEVNQSRDL